MLYAYESTPIEHFYSAFPLVRIQFIPNVIQFHIFPIRPSKVHVIYIGVIFNAILPSLELHPCHRLEIVQELYDLHAVIENSITALIDAFPIIIAYPIFFSPSFADLLQQHRRGKQIQL